MNSAWLQNVYFKNFFFDVTIVALGMANLWAGYWTNAHVYMYLKVNPLTLSSTDRERPLIFRLLVCAAVRYLILGIHIATVLDHTAIIVKFYVLKLFGKIVKYPLSIANKLFICSMNCAHLMCFDQFHWIQLSQQLIPVMLI